MKKLIIPICEIPGKPLTDEELKEIVGGVGGSRAKTCYCEILGTTTTIPGPKTQNDCNERCSAKAHSTGTGPDYPGWCATFDSKHCGS